MLELYWLWRVIVFLLLNVWELYMRLLCCSPHLIYVHLTLEIGEPITKFLVGSVSSAGVSYTGSEIINVHETKEQREHNKTLFPNPNQNNNGSFVLRHLSPVHEGLPVSSVSQVWSLILLKERWENFQWPFFDTDTSVLFQLYNESIFIGQDWPIYMGLKLCRYIAIKQNWMQCWQYSKGLMYLRTIFRLTNLVFLGQCSSGP